MADADDMIAFRAIARSSTLSAAARSLGTSKQALSRRLGRIEVGLGVTLVIRHVRGLELTEAGSLFARYCETVHESVTNAQAELERMRTEVRGLLRLSAPPLLRRLLMPLIGRMAESSPDLRIDLLLTNRFVDLAQEEVHIAIRVGDMPDSDLTSRRVGFSLTHYVASPAWLAAHADFDPRRLEHEALSIVVGENAMWTFGPHTVEVLPRLRTDDVDSACAAAVEGMGLAALPPFVYERHLALGELALLPVFQPAAERDVNLVFSERDRSLKVERFADEVERILAEVFPKPPR